MDKRKVTTSAAKNSYLFSNPKCRNIWLQISPANSSAGAGNITNNIYIVAGEIYENINLDLTGNIYINGA